MADEFDKLEHFSISPGAQLAGSTKLHINRMIFILITSLHTNTKCLKDLEPSSHNLTTHCPPPPTVLGNILKKLEEVLKSSNEADLLSTGLT